MKLAPHYMDHSVKNKITQEPQLSLDLPSYLPAADDSAGSLQSLNRELKGSLQSSELPNLI